MKPLKPLPHGVIDYAWAGMMIAAPWLFGFKNNKKATMHSVGAGLGIIGLSLMTRYPLGAAKVISFPVHGVIEALSGVNTATAPWSMGFSENKAATWTHVASGLGTLAVVAVTDYEAAERVGGDQAPSLEEIQQAARELVAPAEGSDLPADEVHQELGVLPS